jgi:hypothetical protein
VSNEDLLKLLDLEGKEEAPPYKGLALPLAPGGVSEGKPPGPTALVLDGWGLRRGEDVLRESVELQACLAPLGPRERQAHAVADFHATAFEPDPRLADACEDALRREFVKQLLDTPECQGLRATTVLNAAASEVAAASFAAQYAALRKQRQEEEGRTEEDQAEGKEADKEAGKGKPGGPAAGDSFAAEVAVLRGVGKALAAAVAEVEAVREAAAALGLGPGAPGSNDPRAIAALYRSVRSDPDLRRVCELAGRYRRVAQSKQRRKLTHGLDDVVGVAPAAADVPRRARGAARPQPPPGGLRRVPRAGPAAPCLAGPARLGPGRLRGPLGGGRHADGGRAGLGPGELGRPGRAPAVRLRRP